MDVEAQFSFTRPADVRADRERAGLLRAPTFDEDLTHEQAAYDVQTCTARDLSVRPGFLPQLRPHGFTQVDLSPYGALQRVLDRVRTASFVSDPDAKEIRRCLRGTTVTTRAGGKYKLLFIAPEGLFLRLAGPNGISVERGPSAGRGANGHDAAVAVHVDQDVSGTPLRQILRRTAPVLFRHDAPDSVNRWSPLHLLNLWIPLQQVTRPLALMDVQTLDRRRHQLRYQLPTRGFLDRPDALAVNDLWTVMHEPTQHWYYDSTMGPHVGYLFETLGTPHGAFVLPGEDVAAELYRQVQAALECHATGDEEGLRRLHVPSEDAARSGREPIPRLQAATEALRGALRALVAPTQQDVEAGASSVRRRATAALDAVVRKSIEMRVVAVPVPGLARRRG